MQLTDFLNQNKGLQEFIQKLAPQTNQMLTGLNGSGKTLFLDDLLQQQSQPLLIVEPDTFHASRLAEDLGQLIDENLIHTFPVESSVATQIAISSPESLSQRIDALDFLRSQKKGILLTSIAGLEYVLPAVKEFDDSKIIIEKDQDYDLNKLAAQLVAMGYRRDSLVSNPGEFAQRGDIFDIYPLTAEQPVRIEFFGDTADTLHFFDSETQRSTDSIKRAIITPATDRLASSEQLKQAGKKFQTAFNKQIKKVKDADVVKSLKQNFQADIDSLNSGTRPDNISKFVDFLYDDATNLSDYASKQSVLIYDDFERIRAQDRADTEENQAWFTGQLDTGQMISAQTFRFELNDATNRFQQAKIFLSQFQRGIGNIRLSQLFNLTNRSVQQFFSNLPMLKTEVDRWQKQSSTVVMLISDKTRLEKMNQTLSDFEIQATITDSAHIRQGETQLVTGGLASGFEFPDEKLVVITEKELFNKQAKHNHRHRPLVANAERLKSYTELKPGDYVVHVNHGIGKFLGIQTMEVDGKHQDYISIEYRDSGKLFIPVTQLDMVQKYVSAEGKTPRLNKLGGTEWQKTKRKVQKNIEDIADNLIDLYSKREAEKGFAFEPDDDMQRKFDAQFPYVETPDQIRSINEVKHDMESNHPMDRLLVGDVGFGKTEVALRAAFKAVASGKQVAFLVPTTILAQQHYQTMLERFAGFPVNIAIMSRFQTRAEQKKTKLGLADGKVDIVVGTHRLLSKDIKFADLGFLIVDEEQRFGVKHKERLKELKSQIDVLTMTATPIPRTLNMSMMGVRDLSVIETAPPNRYPIQTFVMEQNYDVVRSAIQREMERGGQVFYLHNRVQDMERTADLIQSLVPDANVGIANGQMTEAQLDGIISDFLDGEYDVLVTTTIIETGVDIANANTIIVENADRYGLSQLYQLRGRVGRSSRVAYAYFMYQKDKTLTEVGEKRLEAIKNFTELGSGFKIAMRDLSIRGAGNLLGQQQHGFIDSVGYDMYTQMLSEAVAKRKGKLHQRVETNAEIRLKLEAYIPDTYITDERQKIEMYKRVREVKSEDELADLEQEFRDRFGDYPVQVGNLFKIAHLKLIADLALVKKIVQQDQQIQIMFDPMSNNYLTGELIFKSLTVTKMKAKVANDSHYFVVTFNTAKHRKYIEEIDKFLDKLAAIAQKQTKKKRKK